MRLADRIQSMLQAGKHPVCSPAAAACRLALLLAFLSAAWHSTGITALAAPGDVRFTNPETGYQVYIDDAEDLLEPSEETELLADMIPITDYGSVAFVSDSYVNAENVYRSYFGKDSGTIFLIDMGERLITIYSDGRIYKLINKKYANLIVDNVYKYASRGDYRTCAGKAFEQVYTVLEGGRISQPMRYITNALAAVVLAFLGNFLYVWVRKKRVQIPKTALITGTGAGMGAAARTVITRQLLKTHKSRKSSNSGGGGRSGGGGGWSGGGGGGGHSGGGGSHRF